MIRHAITFLFGAVLGIVLGPNAFLFGLGILVAFLLARHLAAYRAPVRADLPPSTRPAIKRLVRDSRLALPVPIERRWR